ncbi:hypothetical protein F4604DRAFT_1940856 [Suillus subluteus]|nr:hypothetical protein F4604DRAFT_1940856 [Suillus subluteus]
MTGSSAAAAAPSTSGHFQTTVAIAPEARIKRPKYVDLEGGENESIEDEDEDCSFINDHDSEDGHAAVTSSYPLQDEAAWDILEEYLTSEMNFPQMEAKLVSHLGSRYHEEDWTEATRALFSADEDNVQALANLRAVKARHILPGTVAAPSRGSIHQSACAWFDQVADIESRFTSSSGPARVDTSSQPVPSSSEIARQTIKRFIQDEISSSHAYHLLEVEFTDNPTSLAHWESVLDAIVDAVTCEARLKIFDMRAFHVVESISSPASAAVSDQSSRGIGIFEKPVSSTQDNGMASARDLPTWLVTMPFSKTSFLAAQLKSKGFEVYTHSTLPGRLCVKAENTVVIRKAWPSSHTNCFFDIIFVPQEDQIHSKRNLTIPGWCQPIRGQYRHDVGYASSYDPQTDTITLLVASREVPGREVGKDSHVPHLYNPPNNILSSAGRNKTYLYGLLALKLHRNAVFEIPIPAPESIRLHQESRCNTAFMQSTLHAYAAQHWIEGDLVIVRAGEMFGCTVKIQCVDLCTRSALAYIEESVHIKKISHEPIMFAISNLERKFRVGDSIRVLDSSSVTSQLKGKTGMVVQVHENTVDVLHQSSEFEFTVAIDSLATFVGDISRRVFANVSYDHDTPMKGDHVVVTEGFYVREFGVISKIETKSQTLSFFSDSLHQHIWVPIRMTAFNPNPTALRHTHERGYDVVAGDIVQVVRGDPLGASGTVLQVNLDNKTLTFKDTRLKEFTTSIMHVARIGGWADRDPMQHLLGKEDTCVVVVQGRKQEFSRAHVVSWKGVLLTGVYLPPCQLREFLRLARGSFIQSPHIIPPQTPRHSPPPPPDVSHVDQTIPAVEVSVWDAPVDSSVINRYPLSAGFHNDRSDVWSFNEADREERQLHPPSASASSSDNLTAILHNPLIAELCYNWHMKMRVANPSSDWGSYLNGIVDTVAPDPFLLQEGPVKDGEILIRYSSRTKNKGMKEDPIPIKYILPEPPTGKNKKFTLIRGDLMGSIHTTMSARKDQEDITTMEGKKFTRADTCMIINKN